VSLDFPQPLWQDAPSMSISENLFSSSRAASTDRRHGVRVLLLALALGAGAVIVSGGTGIGRRDTTYDTLAPLLEKRLDRPFSHHNVSQLLFRLPAAVLIFRYQPS